MFRSIEVYLRPLVKDPVYLGINVFGLALGVAVFLLMYIAAAYENSFNQWMPNHDRIARVNLAIAENEGEQSPSALTPGAMLPFLIQDFTEIETGTRLRSEKGTLLTERVPKGVLVHMADPNFFEVIEASFLSGERSTVLFEPGNIVLSKRAAMREFNSTDILGRDCVIEIRGNEIRFKVAGVVEDFPENSSIKFEYLIPLSRSLFSDEIDTRIFEQWTSSTVRTFVKLDKRSSMDAVSQRFAGFLTRRSTDMPPEIMWLTMTPLDQLHKFDGTYGILTDTPGINPLVVVALLVVGISALIISSINYTNLATARAARRAKEVAVRKSVGASQKHIIRQFLSESIIVAAVAGLCGLAIVEWSLPALNSILDTSYHLEYIGWDGAIFIVALISILMGLIAGFYPSVVLSSFEPSSILRSGGQVRTGKWSQKFREALVCVQFSASIALAGSALVIFDQSQLLQKSDIGFKRDNLLIINDVDESAVSNRQATLIRELTDLAGVDSVGVSNRAPGTLNRVMTSAIVPGSVAPPILVVQETIGPGYFGALGSELIAGRFLSVRESLDDISQSETGTDPSNVMLNISAAKELGFESAQEAVGAVFNFDSRAVTVTGILKDIRFNAPEESVPAVVYTLTTGEISNPHFLIRLDGTTNVSTIRLIEQSWGNLTQGYPVNVLMAEQALAEFGATGQKIGKLFSLGAIITLIISAFGLLALSAHTIHLRAKEVGIRKALGATRQKVMEILLIQFIAPVLLAVIFGWIALFGGMTVWLSGYSARTDLSLFHFLVPAIAAVSIAIGTVIIHSLELSNKSPSTLLRT